MNIEQIKKTKDGLDVLGDIFIHAVFGEKVSKENLERFKWYGVYAQDENQEYFKLKVPLSMGLLNINQLKVVNLISQKFAQDSLTFSANQKIEFKNLKIYHLPEIFNLLQEVSLNTAFESGHTVRRVLTCPVNGLDTTQLYDVSALADSLDEAFIGNKNYSNLPNKFQIAVSGYEEGCNVQFTPDISFNATKDYKENIVFMVKVLDFVIGYINPSQVINTAKTIAKIYKDFGNRQNEQKSSFASLIQFWGIDEFFNVLNASVNFKIKQDIQISNDKTPQKPRMGIHESKIENQSYIGCKVDGFELKCEKLNSLIDLIEKHKASKLKISHKGNIIILDVPTINAKDLASDLKEIGLNAFA